MGDGLRAPKLKHAVQGEMAMATSVAQRPSVRGRSASPITRLGRLMAVSTRARRVYPVVSLPAHASMLRDVLEVPIALGRSVPAFSLSTAVDRGGTSVGIRMAFDDSAVDARLVIGSVANEGGKGAGDLVEQRSTCDHLRHHGGSALMRGSVQFRRRRRCAAFARTGVLGAMLLDQPLAGSAQTQACAVDQQVNRPSRARTGPWHLQSFGATAQG